MEDEVHTVKTLEIIMEIIISPRPWHVMKKLFNIKAPENNNILAEMETILTNECGSWYYPRKIYLR